MLCVLGKLNEFSKAEIREHKSPEGYIPASFKNVNQQSIL